MATAVVTQHGLPSDVGIAFVQFPRVPVNVPFINEYVISPDGLVGCVAAL